MTENESKADQPKVVAAIPCFNEERFIGSVVAKTKKYVNTVVVIDDGSTDDSAEVAKATGAAVYCHEENRGYGAAICRRSERDSALDSAHLGWRRRYCGGFSFPGKREQITALSSHRAKSPDNTYKRSVGTQTHRFAKRV